MTAFFIVTAVKTSNFTDVMQARVPWGRSEYVVAIQQNAWLLFRFVALTNQSFLQGSWNFIVFIEHKHV
jgi:hypothetical protein